ncbi:MAG: SRPBCC family protein [Solirubrobacterales bacterium]|nr:SRPBCC family protein [Solirubrobacterales bacterium]
MGSGGNFEVIRSAEADAPAERVFPLIGRFKSWTEWSPWEGIDPELKREYSGPESGVGSKYHRVGNRKVGEGRMEITASEPSSRVELNLHFLKPIKAENVTIFELEPTAAGGTTVTWRMRGQQNGIMRVMGVFMKIDKMVGPDFEKGLKQLKSIAESPS